MYSVVCQISRLILLIVANISIAKSQAFNPRYNFKQLNVQNGLTQNIVYHFLQDSRGFMWIGTHNGLSLYDGIRTINFLHNEQDKKSIAGNFITCLLEDSAQQVWIGNENGIDVYNRANNSFIHFGVDRPDGTNENTYCVPLGFVSAMELWFLDTKTKSIRSLNTKSKRTSFISSLNASHAVLYKTPGNHDIHIWSAYDKGTIHQVYKNKRFVKEEIFFAGKDKMGSDPLLEIMHVLQQNDTTVWLSGNKGLVKLNPHNKKYKIFDRFKNQNVRELRFTALSKKGELWAATGPDGIYTFDIKTGQFLDNFKNDKFDAYSICSNNIVSLYFDKIGNAWCGSFGNGASYTNTGSNFFSTHISKKETESLNGNNHISLLGKYPDGNIWCTFENILGIATLDKNFKMLHYRNLLLEDGTRFNGGMYKLLFETREEAWCATNKGLFLYNIHTNKIRPVKYELVSEEVQGSIWINDIIRLQDSSIIFSTFSGLYHITKEATKYIIEPVNFLTPGIYNGFNNLFQDKAGLIYIKTQGDLFYILKPTIDGKHFNLIKTIPFMPEVNQYFNQDGDSILYIASDDGLYHINTNSLQIEKESFNNRIPFLNVSSVFKTKDDKYWIFGETGAYCFDKKNNSGRTYTVEDGLPANEFTASVFPTDPADRCILGTSNGLVSFLLYQQQDPVYPVRAQITNIYINDVRLVEAYNPNETIKLNLTYKENTFSFDFTPIAFQHASECRFEYMLEGYDEEWVKSGPSHFTRYSRISPGNYIFNLRIIDANGQVSPYFKTLEIEIAKAFWQTTVFNIVVLAIIIVACWLLAKWYLNNKIKVQKREFEKQKLVEKERTRIATDMHDDLGAGLSRIKFLSETIGIKKQKQEPIEEDISKIREYSHDMIDKMGEIVWALNEKNDSLSDLFSYTRVYAMEYLAQHGIFCLVDVPEIFPSSFVSGEFRRNVYLTVKEALHNVVKHAQATSVTIKIHANKNLQFYIQDNGVGIDKNNIRPFSNGLMNMEKRIKEMNGEFIILNGKAGPPYGQGTTIKFSVPLPT